MFRKRKRKNKTVNETQPDIPSSVQTSDPNATRGSVGACQETKTPPLLTNFFKSTIEKAADKLRTELVSEGKIKPMAFFLCGDGTMKTVSLSIKDEHQKEALLRRIREKVSAENISTVVILTEMDDGHTVVLSGASPNMRGSACINYSFDNATKTVALWKMTWLSQPAQNVFLDGIFDKTG